MTLPDCMLGPSEPCAGYVELQRQLAEARAVLAANESQAWLGNATTKELLEELMARAEVGGYAKYRTVDIDDDSAALKVARGGGAC